MLKLNCYINVRMNRLEDEYSLFEIVELDEVRDYIVEFREKFECLFYTKKYITKYTWNKSWTDLTIAAHYRRFYMDILDEEEWARVKRDIEWENYDDWLDLAKERRLPHIVEAIVTIYDGIRDLLEEYDEGPRPDPSGGSGTVNVEYWRVA